MTGIHRKKRFDFFPYAIAAPALIMLLLGMLYPILWSVLHSFTDKVIGVAGVFVGFENYSYIFQDPAYQTAIANTAYFTVGAMFGKVLIGISVALILNMSLRFRNMLRTLFLLPWTLPGVVAIYAWLWLYSGNGGLINSILLRSGLLEAPISWLSNPDINLISLMIVNIWRGIPFIAISVLAGLQTIPTELYEASAIDGAGTLNSFKHITLPLALPVILVSSLISTIWTINDFEVVYLLTGGGPGFTTLTIPIQAHRYAFANVFGHIGRASAAALTTIPVLIVLMVPVLNSVLKDDK